MCRTFHPKPCPVCGMDPVGDISAASFNTIKDFRYKCPKCGIATELCTMPWIACEKWNAEEFEIEQISMF